MHPRIEELVGYLDACRIAVEGAVADIPNARRDERPGDGAWTVGEILDHLAIVEAGIARLLDRRADRALAEGVGPDREMSSVLARLDRFGLDTLDRRLEAPEQVRPRAGVRAAEAKAALDESRRALRAAVARLDGLDLTALRARHPVVGEIDLYEWLLFVGKHERRHLLQLESLRRSLVAG